MPAERRLSTDRTLSLPWSNSDALHCLARDCGGKPQARMEDSKMGRNQSQVLSGKRRLRGACGAGMGMGGLREDARVLLQESKRKEWGFHRGSLRVPV